MAAYAAAFGGAQPQGGAVSKAAPAAAAAVAKPANLDPEAVAQSVLQTVQNITMMDDEIHGDEPLMMAGLTSNTVVLLRNELAGNFPHKHMPFTLVFDFPS